MNSKHWPLFVFIILLMLNTVGFAQTCVSVFSPNESDSIERLSSLNIQKIYEHWKWNEESLTTTSTEAKREQIQNFINAYQEDFSQLQEPEQLLIFYKKFRDVLNSRYTSSLFQSLELQSFIRPSLHQLLSQNHERLFRKLALQLNSSQITELFKTLYSLRWLTPSNRPIQLISSLIILMLSKALVTCRKTYANKHDIFSLENSNNKEKVTRGYFF